MVRDTNLCRSRRTSASPIGYGALSDLMKGGLEGDPRSIASLLKIATLRPNAAKIPQMPDNMRVRSKYPSHYLNIEFRTSFYIQKYYMYLMIKQPYFILYFNYTYSIT
jgi:hypothetical protein